MPEKTGEIWLVRHPRPAVPPGLCYGALDIEADPENTAQAARELAATAPQGAVVRCSPALRCRQLADAVMALRPDLRAAGTHAWLREMGLGNWEGQRWDEIPHEEMRAWTDDFAQYQTGRGQGESVAQFLERIENGLRALMGHGWISAAQGSRLVPLAAEGAVIGSASEWREPAGTTVCITHAGVIRGVSWLLGAAERPASEGRGAVRTGGPNGGAFAHLPAAGEWPNFAVAYGEAWRVARSDRE